MIQQIIYNYLEDKSKIKRERSLENILNWSPTDYCRCLRQVYYKKINKEITNPVSIHTLLKWEMGHGIHYQLKELYKKIDKFYKDHPETRDIKFEYIEAESEFMEIEWEGIRFVFQPDDIIEFNNHVFVIENKTKYGQGIDSIKNYGIEKDYEIQLFLYLTFLKIENGEFYFVATDSAYNQDFAYTRESLFMKHRDYLVERNFEIKQVMKDIELYYINNEEKLPEKEGQINLKNDKGNIKYEFQHKNQKYKCYPCSWGQGNNKCAYFDHCWGQELEEIKNHNFYIGGKYE